MLRRSQTTIAQPTEAALEPRTQQLGRQLLAAARTHRTNPLWTEKLIAHTLEDEAFKTELFRFVDVFPVLKTPAAIHQHLLEYLDQPHIKLPTHIALALKAGGLLKGTLANTIASQITNMAERFISGRDLAAARTTLESRWHEGIAFSVDLLGEAVVSHAEAAAYRQRYADLINQLPALVATLPPDHTLDQDHLGPIPRANISIKISALDGHVSPIDTEGSITHLLENISPLLKAAQVHNIFINFDMEHHALKDLTLRLFKRCCETHDFPAGIALQAYLQSADDDARDLAQWSRDHHRLITIRLIKGAYWDFETIFAQLQNWPSPVWPQKWQTDACFERLTTFFLQQTPRTPDEAKNGGGIKLALGTHNARSIAHAIATQEQLGLPPSALEFQMLRGMADDLKLALAQGAAHTMIHTLPPTPTPWRIREYHPLGELIPGMAYFVRRLLENTSNESWLRADHSTGNSDDVLLAAPHPEKQEAGNKNSEVGSKKTELSPHHSENSSTPFHPSSFSLQPFSNEPLRDFSNPTHRTAFHTALSHTKVPHIQSNHTPEDAARAITRAQSAFRALRDTPAAQRVAIIQKAATLMRQDRDNLSALIIKESHKTWAEADGDVCEAIDFCEYYAQQALQLFIPQPLGHHTGEQNTLTHEPRGVAAIISPWNFSLSIPTGMTVAALVTGNTALLKPAEQTPAIAQRLCQLLWQAGIPRDVLHYLPAPGETTGAALVRDPRIALIAFTGSAAVGLDILKSAHSRKWSVASGQLSEKNESVSSDHWPLTTDHSVIPLVIAEMGGKNAIIIDTSADLDEAVLAVRQSAFSYSGQKCSAASRLILLDSIHDAVVARLIESIKSLNVGNPENPATDIGPVIDTPAAQKIWHYIELGKQEATLAYPPASDAAAITSISPSLETRNSTLETRNSKLETSQLIPPHLFTNVLPTHRIAREEIFGPVLAVLRAKNFDHALALANDSPYKLTGGLFSRTPSHLARATTEFRVGNLYLNRPITGALVARQPFGGFGLSGTGPKAGGQDYLQQFTHPKITTENTLRRGFAPPKP